MDDVPLEMYDNVVDAIERAKTISKIAVVKRARKLGIDICTTSLAYTAVVAFRPGQWHANRSAAEGMTIIREFE
jgi:hypothetical protein